MANTRLQQRQAAERERIARYDAVLRAPRADTTPGIGTIVHAVPAGFEARVIRDVADWPAKLKTRDAGRIALAVARHAFACYPVPYHLERIWLGGERLDAAEIVRRKTWYIEVAQGNSLHQTCTKDMLSKKETHRFLNPPVRLSFREALWHALARSYTEEIGLALRIARSKVAHDAVTPFWRDVARFFCANPVQLAELDDFHDYLEARLADNAGYGLKGRTLGSLRAQMAQWHCDLARIRRLGEGNWPGRDIPDWSHTAKHEEHSHKDVTWSVTQIKTGRELAEEGNRMHHCVYTYRHRCISGASSIWSVKTRTWSGVERVLTLEVNAHDELVQVRGYANRTAHPHEVRILRRWAAANGIGGA
jgi:hypothetical protein